MVEISAGRISSKTAKDPKATFRIDPVNEPEP
jgi:hypothetical protein